MTYQRIVATALACLSDAGGTMPKGDLMMCLLRHGCPFERLELVLSAMHTQELIRVEISSVGRFSVSLVQTATKSSTLAETRPESREVAPSQSQGETPND